ncbi:MAG: NUDIX domain-containing protein [Candidatus Nanopelagicales bacterium]
MSDSWVDEYVDKPLLNREITHRGRIWDVVHDTFDIGDFQISRDYIRHTGAVAIVAINQQREILTIRQYRQPVGAYLVEIPAGLLDSPNEDPLLAAKRELVEEAGYVAKNWSVLVDFFTSPGSTTEAVRIYLAEEVLAIETEDSERVDEESEIETRWVTSESAISSIKNGHWQSPTLVLGILAFIALKNGRDSQTEWPARTHLLDTDRVHRFDKA